MASRRTRQISIKECYEILRLQKGADLEALKSAYRRRAFELHPDLNPGNAEASRQFQRLNEAYVALSAILKPQEEARQKAETSEHAHAATGAQTSATENGRREEPKQDKETTRANAAYAEQDVLRDLLNDPFAKRVFEDIYREVDGRKTTGAASEQKTASSAPPPPPEDKREKKPAPPRDRPPSRPAAPWNPGKDKGLLGAIKNIARKQLDEEQTLTMPAAHLGPGAKIRLQIRKGLSDDVTAVDIRLPSDFVVGKPMRLKGLGKKLGSWRGDLYLTIYTS